MMKFTVKNTNPANPWSEVIETTLDGLAYYQSTICGGAKFIIDFQNKLILVLDN